MIDKDDPLWHVLVAGLVVIALGIGWWVFQSNREAAAYNNATGSHVSTWDAMWVELRVQGQAK